MLSTLFGGLLNGVSKLGAAWVESRTAKWQAQADIEKAKAQHAADWDTEVVRQMQSSWKDEVLMLIWFSPIVVAWFNPEAALSWITFVTKLPSEWWLIAAGIVAATFGLRWLFTSTGKNVLDKKLGN